MSYHQAGSSTTCEALAKAWSGKSRRLDAVHPDGFQNARDVWNQFGRDKAWLGVKRPDVPREARVVRGGGLLHVLQRDFAAHAVAQHDLGPVAPARATWPSTLGSVSTQQERNKSGASRYACIVFGI